MTQTHIRIDLAHAGSGCCDRCHGGPGVLLEDNTGTRKSFCLACLTALIRAVLPTLDTVTVEA
jgi:hypothetical protein